MKKRRITKADTLPTRFMGILEYGWALQDNGFPIKKRIKAYSDFPFVPPRYLRGNGKLAKRLRKLMGIKI